MTADNEPLVDQETRISLEDIQQNFQFEDWSQGLTRTLLEKTLRQKYADKGFVFPTEGPFLMKVFATSEKGLTKLERWAKELGLEIDESRQGRGNTLASGEEWKVKHIDLYGPALKEIQAQYIDTQQVKIEINHSQFISQQRDRNSHRE